jgi:hypothetical protein
VGDVIRRTVEHVRTRQPEADTLRGLLTTDGGYVEVVKRICEIKELLKANPYLDPDVLEEVH